jgi:hypothetical protein
MWRIASSLGMTVVEEGAKALGQILPLAIIGGGVGLVFWYKNKKTAKTIAKKAKATANAES